MTRTAAFALLSVWLTVFPASLVGQTRAAELSSMVTLPVSIPAGPAEAAMRGEAVRYLISVAPGFRLVGESAGELDLRPGEPLVLPITVSVGPGLEAGPRSAAVIEYVSSVGADTVTAFLEVETRHGLALQLTAVQGAGPGSRLRVPYELTSSGNVEDAVTLHVETTLGRVRGGEQEVVIPPFASINGVVEIDVSHDALPGPSLVVVRATGRRASRLSSLEVTVGSRTEGIFGSLVALPTRLFVGSSIRPGVSGSTFGLEAVGDLRPGVRLTVSAHDAGSETSTFAFRGLQSGSGFRVQLASRSFTAAVGDVSTRTASFTGYHLQGLGAALDVASGPVRAIGHVARPAESVTTPDAGHQLAGGIDIRTPFAIVGLRGLEEERASGRPHDAGSEYELCLRQVRTYPAIGSLVSPGGGLAGAGESIDRRAKRRPGRFRSIRLSRWWDDPRHADPASP